MERAKQAMEETEEGARCLEVYDESRTRSFAEHSESQDKHQRTPPMEATLEFRAFLGQIQVATSVRQDVHMVSDCCGPRYFGALRGVPEEAGSGLP